MARFHLEHLCVLHVREHLSNLFLSFVRLSMVFAQDRRAPAPGRHIAHAKEKQKAGDGTVPSSQRNDDGGPPEIGDFLVSLPGHFAARRTHPSPCRSEARQPRICLLSRHTRPRPSRSRPEASWRPLSAACAARDLPCLTSSVASRARPSVLRSPRHSPLMLLLLQTPGLTAP